MILPTKHIGPEESLLGIGGTLLRQLRRPQTVSALWEDVREWPEVATFERFALSLDVLYACGLVSIEEGLLRRVRR
ncbi:ABC-three component system middle component 6 [uncultured Brevundimonas sp.]|uniref:ABC-three component system middle component 6 n=1 Tax=uncultured Brevundimonas sp. TaxID=213418 RepID=UPI00345DC7A0